LSSAAEAARHESDQSHAALLKRLFPEAQGQPAPGQYSAWAEGVAKAVKEAADRRLKEASDDAKNSSSSNENKGEVKQLKEQNDHYKSVLADTV